MLGSRQEEGWTGLVSPFLNNIESLSGLSLDFPCSCTQDPCSFSTLGWEERAPEPGPPLRCCAYLVDHDLQQEKHFTPPVSHICAEIHVLSKFHKGVLPSCICGVLDFLFFILKSAVCNPLQ